MTDKQKEAIELLNSLNLDKNKYFLLLEFVLQKQQIEYMPVYPTYPVEPLKPYPYTWETICNLKIE